MEGKSTLKPRRLRGHNTTGTRIIQINHHPIQHVTAREPRRRETMTEEEKLERRQDMDASVRSLVPSRAKNSHKDTLGKRLNGDDSASTVCCAASNLSNQSEAQPSEQYPPPHPTKLEYLHFTFGLSPFARSRSSSRPWPPQP